LAPFDRRDRLKQLWIISFLAAFSGESLQLIMKVAEHLSNFANRGQVVFAELVSESVYQVLSLKLEKGQFDRVG
jgi:hypothetical protein